jgi:hypothetical protein
MVRSPRSGRSNHVAAASIETALRASSEAVSKEVEWLGSA